jgi:hypothetical protein
LAGFSPGSSSRGFSLSGQDQKNINTYTASEDAIEWCKYCKMGKAIPMVQFEVETIDADISSTKDEDVVIIS